MIPSRGVAAALVALALVAVSARARAQEPAPSPASTPTPEKSYRDLITDDEDGRLDVSELVYSRALVHFLPIPILVTEPAVGYGGGLGAIFFHQPPDRSSGQLLPPSVSIGAGMLTSDGSWAGGGGHFHSWKSDTWRAQGFAGKASLDLTSSGVTPGLAPDREVAYTIDSTFLLLEGSRKVSPRWRLGLRYVYVGSDVSLERKHVQDAPPISGESNIGGLTLVVRFDSRDNLMSPRHGQRFDFRPAWFASAFGSDAEFMRVDTDYTGYWRREAWGFAVRLDVDTVEEGAPFYAKPYVDLRGVPAMELLGQRVFSGELQVDRDFDERWNLLGFVGAGEAWNDLPARGRVGRDVTSGGVGFRYLLARILGLRAGVDVAGSSDGDHAFYIVMGSAWR